GVLRQETQLEAHEALEQIEEGGRERAKKTAVLIALLAAMLAICEASGKGAQNESIIANIEASDDWAFYQAKTVRVTVIKTQADTLEAMQDNANARISRQIAALRAEQKRLDSDPKTQEGRKEMGLRAKISETRRDHALAAYHNFEYGSAAFQLAIVLASAAVITEVSTL